MEWEGCGIHILGKRLPHQAPDGTKKQRRKVSGDNLLWTKQSILDNEMAINTGSEPKNTN